MHYTNLIPVHLTISDSTHKDEAKKVFDGLVDAMVDGLVDGSVDGLVEGSVDENHPGWPPGCPPSGSLLRFHCLKAGYPPSVEVDKEDVEAAAVEVDREVARAHSPSSVSNCSGAPPLLKLFPSHFGYKI